MGLSLTLIQQETHPGQGGMVYNRAERVFIKLGVPLMCVIVFIF